MSSDSLTAAEARTRILRMADAVGSEGDLDDDAIQTLRSEGFQLASEAKQLQQARADGTQNISQDAIDESQQNQATEEADHA